MTGTATELGPFWGSLARRARVPRASRLHPVWRVAETTSRAWVRRFGLVPEGSASDRLRESQLARLVGRFYPSADTPGLCLATDTLAWAFIIDDVGDESPLGSDPEALRTWLTTIEKAFDDTPIDEPLALALRDLDQRVGAAASEKHHAAFRSGVQEFFGGLVWEAGNRVRHEPPTLRAFIDMRPAAGAASIFIALLEHLENHDLPDDWRASRDGERTVHCACNAMCWINDLLSVEKELRHDDMHNLVLVASHEYGLSLPEATEHALEAYNGAVKEFGELRTRLRPKSAPRRFADGLANMIAGTRTWTLESARYRAADGRQLQT